MVVAHATGTPKGDEAEIRALNRVFVDAGNDHVVVTGLKGHTGHTGASSGGMNLIAGVRPCTADASRTWPYDGARPGDPIRRPLHEPRSVDVRVLQVNSFGFGGQNALSSCNARSDARQPDQ